MKAHRIAAVASVVIASAVCSYLRWIDASLITSEVVTFLSITSASILAALSGLVFGSHVVTDENTKALVDRGNRFWGAFLIMAICCALLFILGEATKWPDVPTPILKNSVPVLDILAFITFGFVGMLMLFDFVPMLKQALNLRRQINELEARTKLTDEFEMPEIEGAN